MNGDHHPIEHLKRVTTVALSFIWPQFPKSDVVFGWPGLVARTLSSRWMSPQHFDRSAVARMMKFIMNGPCGCVREGIQWVQDLVR